VVGSEDRDVFVLDAPAAMPEGVTSGTTDPLAPDEPPVAEDCGDDACGAGSGAGPPELRGGAAWGAGSGDAAGAAPRATGAPVATVSKTANAASVPGLAMTRVSGTRIVRARNSPSSSCSYP
jgi:hypothetical protein